MTRLRGALALGAALGLLVCAPWGAIPDDELPSEPIAIHYRTAEQARRHHEALARAAQREPAPGGPRLVGSKAHLRADMNALGSFLSEALGLAPPASGADRGRLALLDPRTGELEMVASALPGAVPLAWSADHERLLFAQSPDPEGGALQVYEWSRSDETVRPVTTAPPVHTQACHGPAGRVVATAVEGRAEAARSWIRASQPGGRGPWRDLSSGPADHSPTCAQGGAVAFVRARADGRSELWITDAEGGGEPRRLGPGHHPRFAARGEWLFYAARRGRSTQLFRVRADGTGRAPIGRDARDGSWPAPSPDGAYVAYVASEQIDPETTRWRVLVRRLDGSGDRVLLEEGEGEHPVW